jgi:hypothetical protein
MLTEGEWRVEIKIAVGGIYAAEAAIQSHPLLPELRHCRKGCNARVSSDAERKRAQSSEVLVLLLTCTLRARTPYL